MKLANITVLRLVGASMIGLLVLILVGPQLSKPLMTLSMLALAVLVVAFCIFIFREQPRDEREAQPALMGGQASYMVGAGILLIGIVVESFGHNLDPYLPVALGAMVFSKLLSTRTIQ
jgi:peptidoglycan/LPS O-acetylase OafA/YrhL